MSLKEVSISSYVTIPIYNINIVKFMEHAEGSVAYGNGGGGFRRWLDDEGVRIFFILKKVF